MARKKSTSKRKNNGRKRRVNAKSTRGGTKSRRKKRTSRRRKKGRDWSLSAKQKALISGIAVIFFTAILVLSLLSPNQGQLTSALSGLLMRLFGLGGYVVPIVTGIAGLYLVFWGMDQPLELPVYRVIGGTLFFIVVEAFASLWVVMRPNGLGDVWTVAQAQRGGGYFGGLFTYALVESIGNLGAIFTLMVIGTIGVVLASGLSRAELADLLQRGFEGLKESLANVRQSTDERELVINNGRSRRSPSTNEATQPPLLPDDDDADEEADPEPEPTPAPARSRRKRAKKEKAKKSTPEPEPTIVSPVFLGNNGRSDDSNWRLPAVDDILEVGGDQDASNTILREQVEIIEHTLESFGAPATVVEINQGPTITQFGVEPSFIERRGGKRTKVKVGKIAGLADDLALALAAESIRIQAPVPGKAYVGIEVPNPAKALVSLRDVMETAEFQRIGKKSQLAIGLGQNVAGQPIVADLAAMPHLLIAGTTGSGKSVCVNAIISSLLLRNTPETLKLVMVDPKRVELTGYNGVPHLAAPVIVDMEKVIGTLQWALREMDSRYKMFADIGARNILDYNKKVRRHKKLDPLPFIVIVIDELADLMMLSPEDTERAVTRLAQLARATGMHMVIATQRPSVDVVTGLIKANFPARVAFAVASGTDSRVILDTTGAERLLGQGDMLYQSPDAAAPVRAQGCFVSDDELGKLIGYWQSARRFNLIKAEDSIQPRAKTELPPPSRPPKRETPKSEAETVEAPVINMDRKPSDAETVPNPAVSSQMPEKDEEKPTPEPRAEKKATRPNPPPPDEAPLPSSGTAAEPLWEALEEMEGEEEENPLLELDDDLLPEAIELVRELDKASTSLLQRRLRIGYTRAARMIDYMEEAGIIGPPTGTSKARDVLPAEGKGETAAADEE